MATLTRLFIHPVKSMRGIGLTHALADVSGLAFDRIFMVTEPDGTFITARQVPQMVRFTPSPVHDGLHLTAPDGSSVWVRFADFSITGFANRSVGQSFYRANCARCDQQMVKRIFLPRGSTTLGRTTNDAARKTPQ